MKYIALSLKERKTKKKREKTEKRNRQTMRRNVALKIHPLVSNALAKGTPVVALESTILSHGMPYPQNLECALKVEDVVRSNGAVPATIAILDGNQFKSNQKSKSNQILETKSKSNQNKHR